MKKVIAVLVVLMIVLLPSASVPTAEAGLKDKLKKAVKKAKKNKKVKKLMDKATDKVSEVTDKFSAVDIYGKDYLIAFDDEVVLKG